MIHYIYHFLRQFENNSIYLLPVDMCSHTSLRLMNNEERHKNIVISMDSSNKKQIGYNKIGQRINITMHDI